MWVAGISKESSRKISEAKGGETDRLQWLFARCVRTIDGLPLGESSFYGISEVASSNDTAVVTT